MRLSFGTSVRSRFCKAGVRLLLCKLWFVNNPSMLYRKSLPPSFLRIDEWRLAGDGDRFREGTNLHVGVDGCREANGDGDAVALERIEAGEREGHCVGAWPQIDDRVAPVAVGDNGPDFFNQD